MGLSSGSNGHQNMSSMANIDYKDYSSIVNGIIVWEQWSTKYKFYGIIADYISGMTDYISGMTDYISGMTDYISGMTDYISDMADYINQKLETNNTYWSKWQNVRRMCIREASKWKHWYCKWQ